MRDTELYFHLLGLEKPWTVERVELSVQNRRTDSTVQGAAQILGLRWFEVMLLIERAVAKGQKQESAQKLPKTIGIDEKHTPCGMLTLVNDLDTLRVTKVLTGVKKEPARQQSDRKSAQTRARILAAHRRSEAQWNPLSVELQQRELARA